MTGLVPNRNIKIMVVGDVMLDRIFSGIASRLSPEAPVPVVALTSVEDRAGGASNVALNINTLGYSSVLVGMTGDDSEADLLEGLLEQRGVNTCFDRITDCRTTTKTRVLSSGHQLVRIDQDADYSKCVKDGLLSSIRKNLHGVTAIVISDYNKGTVSEGLLREVIDIAQRMDLPVLVDPKGDDFSKYSSATILTPNLAEFEKVVGVCSSREEMIIKGSALQKELQLNHLLVTLGPEGMALISEEQETLFIPSEAKEVFDVTGAGDTVIAMLSVAIASGMQAEMAVKMANKAAGIVVGKIGTSSISLEEIDGVEPDLYGANIVSEYGLETVFEKARNAGSTIVMTNGCFDILHSGHTRFLDQAARLGDVLVVAVNSDESIKLLKGSSRPINSLTDRLETLASLASVDYVVPFYTETPLSLYQTCTPDVLVKGGDYLQEEIVGAESVMRKGGRVVALPYHEGRSTSNIINRISS
jgi:D-beta-D-heptose 7-phosphate kinase / D-beta-D-heptose 1-phosphate adenosyltransferase